MITDDVKIYNAARHYSVPKLPLREVLDFVAIECVYEPKGKDKKVTIKRQQDHKRGRKNKNSLKSSYCGCLGKKVHTDEFSDIHSQARSRPSSRASSLTMTVLSGGKIKQVRDVIHSELIEDEDTPSLTFTDGDLDSGEDIDDMTISTVALIGDHDVSPEFVFTQADNEESTKWWYEKSSHVHETSTEILPSHISCVENMSIMIIDQASCCSLISTHSFDVSEDDHDLKLVVSF